MPKFNLKTIAVVAPFFLSISCSTIQQMGQIGPKKLGVYSIANNDFLSASRMVVILDEKGNVAAYSGGTVSGLGTVGLQTTATLATAGAIAYGGRAVEQGLTHANASANVKGIPSHVNIEGVPSKFKFNSESTVNVKNSLVP